MSSDDRWPWRHAVADLLERSRLAQPDDLPAVINEAVEGLGLDITIYLVDHEQRTLRAVPRPGRGHVEHVPVARTPAGQAFMLVEPIPEPITEPADAERYRVWMPLVDGTERLGVLEVVTPTRPADPHEFQAQCDMFTALVGHLVSINSAYGDVLARTRRSRRMSVASELLWRMVPPLTYACERFVVSAVLEPCYEVGGDGFDYAVDHGVAHLVLLDTAGHGLAAGLGTAVALSALRAARRDAESLPEAARAVDAALAEQFTDLRFTTGVLARLDLDTGRLSYVNAGHPPPLIVRDGRVLRRLTGGRRLPMGIADPTDDVGEDQLEPGDRLLCYTDGVVEARDTHGVMFGEQRLVDLAERHSASGLPAPETLRRLSHAVLAHLDGPPVDDATLMLVEWSSSAAHRTLP